MFKLTREKNNQVKLRKTIVSTKIVAMSYLTQTPIQKPRLGQHCCLVKNIIKLYTNLVK